MTLKQLSYFLEIANCGNMSKAAKKLNIAQPPLSIQLKALEEELQTKLFDRNTRYMQLTEAGTYLYDRASQVLELIRCTENDLKGFQSSSTGTLTLGMISSCGCAILDHKIQLFRQKFPNVHFEISEGNTFELLDKLRKRELDLAVIRTPFDSKDLQYIEILNEPFCAVGIPALLSECKTDCISLTQLSALPLIYYKRFENLIQVAFLSQNLPNSCYCKNEDARTSLMWARAGMGVALVPRSIIQSINVENLSVKEILEPTFHTSICIASRKEQYLSQYAKEFLQIFSE
ncbi:MAG: LysR family transcriptional regulator [Lachnospiraceae bacterium]|nr:LysR family transcriptional regulator [Lachnospiraceae bacterium]